MSQDEKLAKFLQDVANWSWKEFAEAERDDSYSTNEAVVFSLIRACAMEQMDAIRLSLHRLDGKLKTPIKIEYPKVYYLFPFASLPAPDQEAAPLITAPPPEETEPEEGEVITGPPAAIPAPEPEPGETFDLKTMTLRETLRLMGKHPRKLPAAVVMLAQMTDVAVNDPSKHAFPQEIPMVKSVIAAHLLAMAQKRDITALTEVFDQIDGKLVETLQILGDDIFITDYSLVAPEGATPNENGVLQLEATKAQQIWAQKLEKDKK